MAESPPDFTDYLTHIGHTLSLSALIAGFLLTVITLLLTQLPYEVLSAPISQIILLYLALLFNMWLALAAMFALGGLYWIKHRPPKSRARTLLNLFFSIALIGLAPIIPILFLLWNFIDLALAAALQWVIVASIFIVIYMLYRRWAHAVAGKKG